jgi:DNA modification methylase
MQIYQRPLSDIKPYEKNPRQKYDIQKVAQSIKEFGFQQPIVVDRAGVIIVGHGRYQASKSLGLETVPVVIADLSPEKAKAYRIADNKTNEYSDWDIGLLQQEFTDLLDINYDLELTGFDADELEKLIVGEKEGLTDEDAVPETPEEPKAQLGDIYKLGEHRLMCGDSTMIDQVEKLMNNQKADLIFTDPPYNVDYGKLKGNQKNNNRFKERKIMNDFMDEEQFIQFLTDCFTNAKIVSKTGCSIYVCYADKQTVNFFLAMRNIDLHHSCNIIWKKDSLVLGMSDYHSIHEPIIYGWFKGASHTYYGDKKQTTVWECKRPKKNDLHPTMKPIELVEKAIKNSSKSDDILYEPFGGGGSTLIACEKTNRKCYMMELDPKYIDVIIKRWEQYTGQKAEKIN